MTGNRKDRQPQRSSRHNHRAAASGTGVHFLSPLKPRDTRKKKAVVGLGRERKTRDAKAVLDALLRGDDQPGPCSHSGHPSSGNDAPGPSEDTNMDDWMDEYPTAPSPPRIPIPAPDRSRRVAKLKRHETWDMLLPTLETPLAQYGLASHGQRPSVIPSFIQHRCIASCGIPINTTVQCLYLMHPETVQVATCSCMPVAALLVQHGVFPTSPSQPWTAMSIDLLEIYRALFERSCDAITAIAAALHTIYDRRGFRVMSSRKPGHLAKDPFRAGITEAVQWYSNLCTRMQNRVDAALAAAEDSILHPTPTPAPLFAVDASDTNTDTNADTNADTDSPPATPSRTPATHPAPDAPDATTEAPSLTPGRADRILRERCPACFGLDTWGRPLSEGGDVQLGADGCFSYRHLRSAGDGPISYDPTYFISQEKVDNVRARILQARKKRPAKCTPLILQEAIDACESSWDAANEKKQKVDPHRHDASGVFVMTCRHSQVLFLCNINTPGEQQQFVISLIEEVASHLPPEANIVQAYDVGCVTDHSLNLFPILSDGLRERVTFVINAMHAFGHQWVCQLVYSPRLRRGLGLTDGEGVERFWSRIRKLIGITRQQWNSRRIWMIDKYAAFVNEEGRDNLGAWIERQQDKNLTTKCKAAKKILKECRIPEAELRRNWEDQKTAQTSIRSHAPVRLKRELDKVLSLQAQIDTVETSIADVKKSIAGPEVSPDSLQWLRGLETTHATLSTQAEALYASLNIQEAFPELRELPLEFVRTLIILRDLKINIRKRAVGSFWEWETLDRAVGGMREALGTKLHQSTRKAISKRQPALLRSIAKFNALCMELARLRPPGCSIPVPSPLSTKLDNLREDPSLHEDIWITPTEGRLPRWLSDADVRDGIRALHSADRCAEEAQRLNLERANMSRWLTQELAIVTAAMEALDMDTLEGQCLALPLQIRLDHLQFVELSWASTTQIVMDEPEDRTAEDPFESEDRTTAPNVVQRRPRRRTVEDLFGPEDRTTAPSIVQRRPQRRTAEDPFEPGDRTTAPSVVQRRPRRTATVEIQIEAAKDPFEPEDHVGLSGLDATEASDAVDPNTINDPDDILDVQDALRDGNDGDDESTESTVDPEAMSLEIKWKCPPNLSLDTGLLQCFQEHINFLRHIDQTRSQRVIVGTYGRHNVDIQPADLARVENRTGQLNGYGLNALAAALLAHFGHVTSPYAHSANGCALFSTYDLARVRYHTSDAHLWRHTHLTRYWEKPIWIIPIHRPDEEHWVLAVVSVQQQELYFFDSLGVRGRAWRHELREVMVLITRMVVLANRNQHPMHVATEEEPWIARPLFNVVCPFTTDPFSYVLSDVCPREMHGKQTVMIVPVGFMHDRRHPAWIPELWGFRGGYGVCTSHFHPAHS